MKKHIHFVGIKGVGMTPLAIIAKEAGCTVTGSDIDKEFITDAILREKGITPLVGFSPSHITTPDLVITTGAHGGFTNIEVTTAKAKGIPVITHAEAAGLFINGTILEKKYKGVSIAGTHGKTTTTGMLATVLMVNDFDPAYLIGTGDVGSIGAPGHFGKGDYFIAEADEYATEPTYDKTPRFLWQHPFLAVITSIEFDHPDLYPSLDEVTHAFADFVKTVDPHGALIVHGNDAQIHEILPFYDGKVITYGFSERHDYYAEDIHLSGSKTLFTVKKEGKDLGNITLQVSGKHNVLNALATIAVCDAIGLSFPQIQKGLHAFRGSKRRLEFIATSPTGTLLYDDYAHHPTEIKATLQTLREQYPNKQIVCIFQPHTYSRTKQLFTEFTESFLGIENLFVIITGIYASLREPVDKTVSGEQLAKAIQETKKEVCYFESLEDVVQYIKQKQFGKDTIIVTMGAGDVYEIHTKLWKN